MNSKLFASILLVVCFGATAQALPADPLGENLVKFAQANDDFGLALLHQLELEEQAKSEPSNLFISPFSISTVLGMLLTGSANQTYGQIYQTLGFEQSKFTDTDIFNNFKELFHQLKQKTEDKKNELQVANTIAVQKDFTLREAFLQTISTQFDSRVFTEDFATSSHQATADINKWVADKTNGKIDKLFDQDLAASTVLVLLNAIYFKGQWKTQFEGKNTAPVAFKSAPTKSAPVPTMMMEHKFKLAQFDDGQLLELPYVDESLSMVVFLPSEAEFAKQSPQTLSSLLGKSTTRGAANLASRIAQLHSRKVAVQLPKFKIADKYALSKPLQALGMKDAFELGKADLSNINDRKDLSVSEVLHKTFVEVNEEGSEAAAVTGGTVVTAAIEIAEQFNADRPFLFMIRDNQQQLTLFAGVVNKP